MSFPLLMLVCAGLLVRDVGAGACDGPLISADLLTPNALGHPGRAGLRQARFGRERVGGAALMVAGILLVSIF